MDITYLHWLLEGEKEPSPKFVSRVNNELMAACDECLSTYFGYNRFILSNLCMTDYSPPKCTDGSQNTFNDNLLTVCNFAFRMMKRETG